MVETLKGFGVEGVEHLLLPDDPNNEGKSKGFAFLEFSSHSDAMAAFQRLRKPDAVLGCERSAKVSFAQTPINPSEELLLQVNNIFVYQYYILLFSMLYVSHEVLSVYLKAEKFIHDKIKFYLVCR